MDRYVGGSLRRARPSRRTPRATRFSTKARHSAAVDRLDSSDEHSAPARLTRLARVPRRSAIASPKPRRFSRASPPARWRLAALATALAGLLVGLAGCGARQQPAPDEGTAATPVAAEAAPDLDGPRDPARRHRAGAVRGPSSRRAPGAGERVASWCVPCREEFPEVLGVRAGARGRGRPSGAGVRGLRRAASRRAGVPETERGDVRRPISRPEKTPRSSTRSIRGGPARSRPRSSTMATASSSFSTKAR